MGLVNAFINQIGREIGRDAYRSFPRGKRTRKQVPFEARTSLVSQVKSFELLEDHQATMRLLTNIVEKAEHANPQDFEWQELFSEIDNKIDFCKENLPAEYAEQLNRLDELNAANFKNVMSEHLVYIDTVIQFYENKGNAISSKNNALVYLSAFFGLRSFYLKEYTVMALVNVLFVALLFIMAVLGYLTYIDPIHNAGNLPNDTPEQILKIANLGVGIMSISAILYCLQVVLAFRKIFAFKKTILENNTAKDKFVKYRENLLKN
jgi:hypothetical protein